jgi:hypothetical protein
MNEGRNMRKQAFILLCLSCFLSCIKQDKNPRMNDVQLLGSHNSYKLDLDPALKAMLEEQRPGSWQGLEYGHVSLQEQLDHGLRKLELDVVYDPEGGKFAQPVGYVQLMKNNMTVSAFDPEGIMNEPGFKVLHVPDIDFRTNCYTFIRCLEEVRDWSRAHPDHYPIAIMMNAKDGGVGLPGFTEPLKFDAAAFEAWDAEIRSVFDEDHLLSPDDVRGGYESLEAAVLSRGWPELDDVRGTVYFILDHSDEKMQTYIRNHPSLKGRAMFVNAPAGMPEAAFMVINDPIRDQDKIRKMVKLGYMVRTRSDANTTEARNNDYSRFEAARASGAQIISTDYYYPDTLFGTGFHISLGDSAEQCNPVLSCGG